MINRINKRTMSQEEIEKFGKVSRDLKDICREYVTKHLSEDFARACEEMEIDLDGGESDQVDLVRAMDTFIFSGETTGGVQVLDEILEHAKLSKNEKKVTIEWRDKSFESVFEVLGSFDGGFRVLDVVAEVEYDICGNDREVFNKMREKINEGCFLVTRIAPVHGIWFLSGVQIPLPASMQEFIFKNFVLKNSFTAQVRNNEKKLQKAVEMQKEYYDHFVRIFGTDELSVSGKEVVEKEREFFASWMKNLGKDDRESYMRAESLIPDGLQGDFEEFDEVAILVDPRDGMYVVPNYKEFQMLFLDPALGENHRKENILNALEEEDFPAICFRRMCDRYPEAFREGMKIVFPKICKKFDPVQFFNGFMDEYKPGWDTFSPSITLMNERFKKWYYAGKSGRNDPCPCGARNENGKPVKYKKCHGK